jgi:hypothetical protein
MDLLANEKELIRKQVFAGHLNVPERKTLPEQKAKASLISSVIEEALQSRGWFRAWWLPDDSMVGCEIEYRGDSSGRISWRYSGIESDRAGIREYGGAGEAAGALVRELRQFVGDDIDGVLIDWTAEKFVMGSKGGPMATAEEVQRAIAACQ